MPLLSGPRIPPKGVLCSQQLKNYSSSKGLSVSLRPGHPPTLFCLSFWLLGRETQVG